MSIPSLPCPAADDPSSAKAELLSRRFTAALLGNPNTGKTTLFNALSGLNQRVGNYPGVTVETKKGHMTCAGQPFDLIDLPGTYSLAPRSPDEMVAVDVMLGQQPGERRPDVVVSIVDASNLERNLYLTTQALELGVPVVVALNMIDVAEKQGIRIDAEKLSARLGVPVVPIQANKKRGLDDLRAAVAARRPERTAHAAADLSRRVRGGSRRPAREAGNRCARLPGAPAAARRGRLHRTVPHVALWRATSGSGAAGPPAADNGAAVRCRPSRREAATPGFAR